MLPLLTCPCLFCAVSPFNLPSIHLSGMISKVFTGIKSAQRNEERLLDGENMQAYAVASVDSLATAFAILITTTLAKIVIARGKFTWPKPHHSLLYFHEVALERPSSW